MIKALGLLIFALGANFIFSRQSGANFNPVFNNDEGEKIKDVVEKINAPIPTKKPAFPKTAPKPDLTGWVDPNDVLESIVSGVKETVNKGLNVDMSLPRGIRNNNAGNLVQTNIPWQGKVPLDENTDSRFEQFFDPIYGLRAIYKDIINDYNKGAKSLRDLINIYAPQFENNTNAYVNSVARETGLNPDVPFTLNAENLVNIVKAIVVHENGVNPVNKYWYTDEQFKEAYRKAV